MAKRNAGGSLQACPSSKTPAGNAGGVAAENHHTAAEARVQLSTMELARLLGRHAAQRILHDEQLAAAAVNILTILILGALIAYFAGSLLPDMRINQ